MNTKIQPEAKQTIGFCENCKWWKPMRDNQSYPQFEKRGECKNPKLSYALNRGSWEGSPDTYDNLHAGDCVTYPCEPITGFRFGCVNFEAGVYQEDESES